MLAINPDERLQFRFIEGDLRDPDGRARGVQGRRHRPPPGRARLGAALDQGSDRVAPAQRRRVPERAGAAAKDAGVGRVVYASSSSVYGDHPGLPKHEDRIGKPLSPYAATKRVDEIYAQVFHDVLRPCSSSGCATSTCSAAARIPNGPYAAVIPRWIACAARRQAVRDLRRRLEQPRLLLRRQHRPGEPARRHARPIPRVTGTVYNCGCNGRTDLHAAVRDDPRQPREGASRRSRTPSRCSSRRAPATSRTRRPRSTRSAPRSATSPTHQVAEGMAETVAWFAQRLRRK